MSKQIQHTVHAHDITRINTSLFLSNMPSLDFLQVAKICKFLGSFFHASSRCKGKKVECACPGWETPKTQFLHLCVTTYTRPQSTSLLLSFCAPKDRVRKNHISIWGLSEPESPTLTSAYSADIMILK